MALLMNGVTPSVSSTGGISAKTKYTSFPFSVARRYNSSVVRLVHAHNLHNESLFSAVEKWKETPEGQSHMRALQKSKSQISHDGNSNSMFDHDMCSPVSKCPCQSGALPLSIRSSPSSTATMMINNHQESLLSSTANSLSQSSNSVTKPSRGRPRRPVDNTTPLSANLVSSSASALSSPSSQQNNRSTSNLMRQIKLEKEEEWRHIDDTCIAFNDGQSDDDGTGQFTTSSTATGSVAHASDFLAGPLAAMIGTSSSTPIFGHTPSSTAPKSLLNLSAQQENSQDGLATGENESSFSTSSLETGRSASAKNKKPQISSQLSDGVVTLERQQWYEQCKDDDDDDPTEYFPTHFKAFEVPSASHNLLSRGSYRVTADLRDKFDEAYLDDIVRDAINGHKCVRGRVNFGEEDLSSAGPIGQHSMSEIGFTEAHRPFWDLDFVTGKVPGAADQVIFGIVVLFILIATRIHFPQKTDEQWKVDGRVFVTQTLGRPIAEQEPKTATSSTTATTSGATTTGVVASANKWKRTYTGPYTKASIVDHSDDKDIDDLLLMDDDRANPWGFDVLQKSDQDSSPSTTPHATQQLASILVGDSENSNSNIVLENVAVSSASSLFPSQSIYSQQSSLSSSSSSSSFSSATQRLGGGGGVSSAAAMGAVAPTVTASASVENARKPALSVYAQRIVGIHDPSTVMDSLTLMRLSSDEKNFHKLGMHVVIPGLVITSEQNMEIRATAIRLLVAYFIQNRWLFENSSILTTRADGEVTTAKDMTPDVQHAMWSDIFDYKVYGTSTKGPNKRQMGSCKVQKKCTYCGGSQAALGSKTSGGGSGGASSGANARKRKQMFESRQDDTYGDDTQKTSSSSAASKKKPDPDCPVCFGTGMTSEGPASISDLVYALDGLGNQYLPSITNRILEEDHIHGDKGHPNASAYRYCADAKIQYRYHQKTYEDYNQRLAERPIKFECNGRVFLIDKVPRPFARFVRWQPVSGYRTYLKWALDNTSIRLKNVGNIFAYTESTWRNLRSKGFESINHLDLGPCVLSIGHEISAYHGNMTPGLKKKLFTSPTNATGVASVEKRTATYSSSSTRADESLPTSSFSEYWVLVNPSLEKEMIDFLKTLKPGLLSNDTCPFISAKGSIQNVQAADVNREGNQQGGNNSTTTLERTTSSASSSLLRRSAMIVASTFNRSSSPSTSDQVLPHPLNPVSIEEQNTMLSILLKDKHRWNSLSFLPFRWVKNVAALKVQYEHHTKQEIDALSYTGSCVLALTTGIGSNFCSIQQRQHTSHAIYFRIVPLPGKKFKVIQLCWSASSKINTSTSGALKCCATYGHCLWDLPPEIGERLFEMKPTTSKKTAAAALPTLTPTFAM